MRTRLLHVDEFYSPPNIAKLFNDQVLFQDYNTFQIYLFTVHWTVKFHFPPKKIEKK